MLKWHSKNGHAVQFVQFVFLKIERFGRSDRRNRKRSVSEEVWCVAGMVEKSDGKQERRKLEGNHEMKNEMKAFCKHDGELKMERKSPEGRNYVKQSEKEIPSVSFFFQEYGSSSGLMLNSGEVV